MSSDTPRRFSLRRNRANEVKPGKNEEHCEARTDSGTYSGSPNISKVKRRAKMVITSVTTPIQKKQQERFYSKTPLSVHKSLVLHRPSDLTACCSTPDFPLPCSQLLSPQDFEVVWDCNSPGISKDELKKAQTKPRKTISPIGPVMNSYRILFNKTHANKRASCNKSAGIEAQLDSLLNKVHNKEISVLEHSLTQMQEDELPAPIAPKKLQLTCKPFSVSNAEDMDTQVAKICSTSTKKYEECSARAVSETDAIQVSSQITTPQVSSSNYDNMGVGLLNKGVSAALDFDDDDDFFNDSLLKSTQELEEMYCCKAVTADTAQELSTNNKSKQDTLVNVEKVTTSSSVSKEEAELINLTPIISRLKESPSFAVHADSIVYQRSIPPTRDDTLRSKLDSKNSFKIDIQGSEIPKAHLQNGTFNQSLNPSGTGDIKRVNSNVCIYPTQKKSRISFKLSSSSFLGCNLRKKQHTEQNQNSVNLVEPKLSDLHTTTSLRVDYASSKPISVLKRNATAFDQQPLTKNLGTESAGSRSEMDLGNFHHCHQKSSAIDNKKGSAISKISNLIKPDVLKTSTKKDLPQHVSTSDLSANHLIVSEEDGDDEFYASLIPFMEEEESNFFNLSHCVNKTHSRTKNDLIRKDRNEKACQAVVKSANNSKKNVCKEPCFNKYEKFCNSLKPDLLPLNSEITIPGHTFLEQPFDSNSNIIRSLSNSAQNSSAINVNSAADYVVCKHPVSDIRKNQPSVVSKIQKSLAKLDDTFNNADDFFTDEILDEVAFIESQATMQSEELPQLHQHFSSSRPVEKILSRKSSKEDSVVGYSKGSKKYNLFVTKEEERQLNESLVPLPSAKKVEIVTSNLALHGKNPLSITGQLCRKVVNNKGGESAFVSQVVCSKNEIEKKREAAIRKRQVLQMGK